MANVRAKLEQLKKQKKRPRIPSEEEIDVVTTPSQAQGINSSTTASQAQGIGENEEEDDGLIEFEIINKAIWHEGYKYIRNSKYSKSWRCSSDRVHKCRATALVTENNGKMMGTRNKFEHTHDPNPDKQKAARKRHELTKCKEAEPNAKNGKLIADVRGTVHDATFMAMGSNNALNIQVHRVNKNIFGNVNTANVMEMDLPISLIAKKDKKGILHRIDLYDSRDHRLHDNRVVLVFAHPEMIEVLKTNDCWAVDGTFKSCPGNFKQVFTIGAMVKHKVIVAAHALLPGKQMEFYQEAFQAIYDEIQPMQPKRIISDFEKAILKAAQNVFPGELRCSGCFFHLSQSMYRNWRKMQLDKLKNDEGRAAARMTFRRLQSLALIPIEHIQRAFRIILKAAPQHAKMTKFLLYFKATYIGLTFDEATAKQDAKRNNHPFQWPNAQLQLLNVSPIFPMQNNTASSGPNCNRGNGGNCPNSTTTTNRWIITASSGQPFNSTALSHNPPLRRFADEAIHSRPKHPPAFWNIHAEAIQALPKTNNAMESSHFHFAKNLGFHPSMSKYLEAFWDDFAMQQDKYRSTKLMPKSNENRHKKDVIRQTKLKKTLTEVNHRKYKIPKEDMMEIINTANYDNQRAILETLDLLAHQLGEFFDGLNFDADRNGDEEESANEDEESVESNDDENVDVESNDDENVDPTEEFIHDIKRPIIRSPASTIDLDMPSTSTQSHSTQSHSTPFY